MKKKDAEKIIKEYVPHKGFYDLSNKPKVLTDIEYAQILDTQNMLAKMEKDKEYLEEFRPITWNEMQNLSAKLNNIIFTYWGDSIFN